MIRVKLIIWPNLRIKEGTSGNQFESYQLTSKGYLHTCGKDLNFRRMLQLQISNHVCVQDLFLPKLKEVHRLLIKLIFLLKWKPVFFGFISGSKDFLSVFPGNKSHFLLWKKFIFAPLKVSHWSIQKATNFRFVCLNL